jgi:hypothetical protein
MDDDLLMIERIDDQRSLCVSPLSRKLVEEAEVTNLGGNRGFFVYEVDDRPARGGIEILAKVASLEAAFRLFEILRALRKQPEAA